MNILGNILVNIYMYYHPRIKHDTLQYIYIYIYLNISSHTINTIITHTYRHIHIQTHTPTYTYKLPYTHINTPMYTHIYIHIYTHHHTLISSTVLLNPPSPGACDHTITAANHNMSLVFFGWVGLWVVPWVDIGIF